MVHNGLYRVHFLPLCRVNLLTIFPFLRKNKARIIYCQMLRIGDKLFFFKDFGINYF